MSDNWLQFIPAELGREPTGEAAKRAVALLSAFTQPLNNDACAKFTHEIDFFSPGANWSGVECPACGADAEPWWDSAVRLAHENKFRDLAVTTPCCGSKTSLHNLHYVRPAGFGKFVLESMNPRLAITPEQEQALADCLGMPLRKIWMHI